MEETRCLFVEILMVKGKVGESVLQVPTCLKPDASCVQLVLCALGTCLPRSCLVLLYRHVYGLKCPCVFFPLRSPCTRTFHYALECPLSCCLTLKGSEFSIRS